MKEQELHNFIAEVIRLRVAQKMFFKTREKQWLVESKKLERAVDEWISKSYTQGALSL